MNVTTVDRCCDNLEEPAGEMCLEMRIFHGGRSLESMQSESHSPRQVVTSDKTTPKYINVVFLSPGRMGEVSEMLFHYFVFRFWKKSNSL